MLATSGNLINAGIRSKSFRNRTRIHKNLKNNSHKSALISRRETLLSKPCLVSRDGKAKFSLAPSFCFVFNLKGTIEGIRIFLMTVSIEYRRISESREELTSIEFT